MDNEFLLKKKILIQNYTFNINNSSVFYLLYKKTLNKDIWKIIFKFLYPKRKQILLWKKLHILNTSIYINLFKYLYLNSQSDQQELNSLNNNKFTKIINILKNKYKYSVVIRDIYTLQYKLYQYNINLQNFTYENNVIKYYSS